MRKLIPVLALALLAVSLVIFIGCSKDEDPVTPPPPCSIALTAPTAGKVFYTGDPVDIRWTTSGVPSTVDIELVSGSLDTFIARGAPNSGFYPWTIKAYGYGTRHNYQIRVMGTGQESCVDTTGQFTIHSLSGCGISFVYDVKDSIPTQTAGDVYTVKWSSTNTSEELMLELWTTTPWPAHTPKEPVFVIDPALPDDESYDWTVSSFNYSDNAVYRFRLTDIHLSTCLATSVSFRIIDNEVCSIALGGIEENKEYNPGETINISVIGTNLPGNVNIKLQSGGSAIPGGDIVQNWDPSMGPYNWAVEDFGFSGTNSYRIRATSADDDYCTGLSVKFSIAR